MAHKKIQDVNQAVAFYEGKLHGLAHPPQSLAEAPDSRLRVVLQKAGYSRMHPNILERLRTALDQAGIDTFPRLDDPGLDRDTRIYFFRSPMPAGLAPSRALFDTERQLEDFLVNNFAALPVFRGLRLRGRQYALGQGRRIDLLCEEKRGGRLVGVELKHHGPDNGLVTQMHRYMTDLTRLANNEGRHVGARGIVITGRPDPDVAADLRTLCSRHGYEVDWRLYRATLKLERAPGWD